MQKIAIFLAMFAIVVSVVVSNSVFANMGTESYVAPGESEESVIETPVEEVEEPTEESDEATEKSTNATDATDATAELVATDIATETAVSKKSSHRNGRISANTSTPAEEAEEVEETNETEDVSPSYRLDFNGDGRTGNLDIDLVRSSWGPCPEATETVDEESFCMGDADLNGVVNFADITMLLANWSPRMRSDINWDDVVGRVDLEMLLADWQSCPSEENAECRADVNSDGEVNFADITTLLADWTE